MEPEELKNLRDECQETSKESGSESESESESGQQLKYKFENKDGSKDIVETLTWKQTQQDNLKHTEDFMFEKLYNSLPKGTAGTLQVYTNFTPCLGRSTGTPCLQQFVQFAKNYPKIQTTVSYSRPYINGNRGATWSAYRKRATKLMPNQPSNFELIK